MATMGACRLLLVCVFCALLCSPAVTADDGGALKERLSEIAEKAMRSKEASERVKKNLTTAEEYVKKLDKVEEAKADVACLTTAVKNAAEAAESAIREYLSVGTAKSSAAVRQSQPTEPPPDMEELNVLWSKGLVAASYVSREVNILNVTSDKLKEMVEKPGNQNEAFKKKLEEIKGMLTTAEGNVSEAIEAHKQLEEKAKEIVEKLEKKPDDSGISSGSGVSGQEGSGGKEGTQSQTDAKEETQSQTGTKEETQSQTGTKEETQSQTGTKEETQSQTDAKEETQSRTDVKDSATHGSHGTESNNSTTNEPSEKNTTLFGVQENNTSDGAHGDAIATCTAAPLLLLLTAVAYAAVC